MLSQNHSNHRLSACVYNPEIYSFLWVHLNGIHFRSSNIRWFSVRISQHVLFHIDTVNMIVCILKGHLCLVGRRKLNFHSFFDVIMSKQRICLVSRWFLYAPKRNILVRGWLKAIPMISDSVIAQNELIVVSWVSKTFHWMMVKQD